MLVGWTTKSQAPARIVLSFRGTASMQNLLSDFQVQWLTFAGVPHCSCMPPASVCGLTHPLYTHLMSAGAQPPCRVCMRARWWPCLVSLSEAG